MDMVSRYGKTALIAGASEGLGAAFSTYLAAAGMDVVLVARRPEPLEKLAADLRTKYAVTAICIAIDLSAADATAQIIQALDGRHIDLLVYNAALSHIGPFEQNAMEENDKIARVNMLTPMNMVQALGSQMLQQGRGAVVLMASLAGFQGSGFLSVYGATKAFDRTLAEGLWYEWRGRGVDVIACCAGATSTPNYINTQPGKSSPFAPRVQAPEEVVKECFEKLGHVPSFVTGTGNKLAAFFMHRLMPRSMAVRIMGDTTRQIYRL